MAMVFRRIIVLSFQQSVLALVSQKIGADDWKETAKKTSRRKYFAQKEQPAGKGTRRLS